MSTSVYTTKYIVESGTAVTDTGFEWTYEKWNDGTAKCWGRQTINTAFTTVAKSITIGTVSYPILYRGDNLFLAVDYPEKLFIKAPCENVRLHSANVSIFQTTQVIDGGEGFNTANHTGAYAAMRVASRNDAVNVIADYNIVGRWK